MTVDADRLAAYVALLQRTDPHGLTRRHRLTQPGKPDRFQRVFVRVASTWIQHRVTELTKSAADGWKPAERSERPRLISLGRFA